MYVVEKSFFEFEFWGGAESRVADYKEHPECIECLENYINELVECGCTFTETKINDFVWFDADDILQEAGLYNDELGLFYDEEGFEPYEDE